MSSNESILKFQDVSFEHGEDRKILIESNFTVRRGSKITLMGQNGAGKSTLFKLINEEYEPTEGIIHRSPKLTIATARQVIPRKELDLTVREFFEKCFSEKVYDIDPRIDEALEIVNFSADHDKLIKSFSGGQQARLLLASALIQNPDLLLLDEPTNNLDKAGIEHLTQFLLGYKKTVIVISHDADFLNTFTQGVLYLNVYNQQVEQYVGNYFDVVDQIAIRIEKEKRKNAQYDKKIQDNKDKVNFFAAKGGKMRLIAKKLRVEIEEMEENKVDERKDDHTIRDFQIPAQENLPVEIMNISSYSIMKDHKVIQKKAKISLRKNQHLMLSGPNGIGKTTLLETLASGKSDGAKIAPGVTVGYYRQDFGTLNFEDKVYHALEKVMKKPDEHILRSTAAGFLITREIMDTKIGDLSEGQKGLVAFAQLVLLKPGILILDEPTNHINFRHLPIIAKALHDYKGAMIIVSHVPEFLKDIRIAEELKL